MLVKISGTDSSREGDASPGPWAVIWEILTDKNCLLYQSEVLWKDNSVVEGPRRAVKISDQPLVHLVAEPLERNAIDSAWGTWQRVTPVERQNAKLRRCSAHGAVQLCAQLLYYSINASQPQISVPTAHRCYQASPMVE